MKKNIASKLFYSIIFAVCALFTLSTSSNSFASGGRLNFMLTNLTGVEIVGVNIAPTNYPYHATENLLNTALEPDTRLYIGPNYYGNERYWNITITWINGFQHTWTHSQLTRYNSYVLYLNYDYVHMRQGYEKAFANYGERHTMHRYTSATEPDIHVELGVPEKVNVATPPTKNNANIAMANNTERTTRDLVFEDEEQEAPVVADSTAAATSGKTIAVKATVELTRDGKTTTVLPTQDFKSNDKVRLIFSSNSDGYVYWVAKGTSGIYQVLFPNKQTGMDNAIVRNKEYTVPSKGSWRFDENKGTETLVCILSPNKVDELEDAIQQANNDNKQGASSIIANVVEGHEVKRTTRDLVFEEEDVNDVNTKTQKSNDDEPFVATYELNHL